MTNGFLFDASLRAIGDQDFVVRLLSAGYKVQHIPKFLAAFTMTGSNMSMNENARREMAGSLRAGPLWVRTFRYPLNILRLFEKFLRGPYYQKFPLEYAIFVDSEASERTLIRAESATPLWKTE